MLLFTAVWLVIKGDLYTLVQIITLQTEHTCKQDNCTHCVLTLIETSLYVDNYYAGSPPLTWKLKTIQCSKLEEREERSPTREVTDRNQFWCQKVKGRYWRTKRRAAYRVSHSAALTWRLNMQYILSTYFVWQYYYYYYSIWTTYAIMEQNNSIQLSSIIASTTTISRSQMNKVHIIFSWYDVPYSKQTAPNQ